MSKAIKKKASSLTPKKKISEISPREYTHMGAAPDFFQFNPSEHRPSISSFVNKAEKWVMIVLLSFAVAAFLGFKFLQNSDLSFNMDAKSNEIIDAANAVSSQEAFKEAFQENRKEARAIVDSVKNHRAGQNSHATTSKKLKKLSKGNSGRKYAQKLSKPIKRMNNKIASKKKTLARR